MTDVEKKQRLSSEYVSSGHASPTAPGLPTVNPALEKTMQETPAAKIHPAFYIMSVSIKAACYSHHMHSRAPKWDDSLTGRWSQFMDNTELDHHHFQQMDPRLCKVSLSYNAHSMAPRFCYLDDTDNVPHHEDVGRAKDSEDDWESLPTSHSFIQMLKACTPVAVLLAGWAMGVQKPDIRVLLNVSIIVIGVIIASIGEIKFVLIGVIFQIGGIIFEAIRLVLVERLLSGAEYKMDPLVSLYYFAPICAIMNFVTALVFEIPRIQLAEVYRLGLWTLLSNACLAFALNISVVFLIGRTSGLVMTLCGVLKDILLVAASIAIWGTHISALQCFGYSIAIFGLVYYKLGAATIKAQFSEINRSWAEYGAKRPVMRKLISFGFVLGLVFMIMVGLAPTVGYDPKMITNAIKDSGKAT
ncbi:MAG: hypothetical protein Q9217_000745 [Psora testacea]